MDKAAIMQEYRQHMAALGFDTSDFSDDELIAGAQQLSESVVALCLDLGESLNRTVIDLANHASYSLEQVAEAFTIKPGGA